MLAFEMVRGRTALFDITVTQADGTPQVLSGLSLIFHAMVGGVRIEKNSSTSPPGIVIDPGSAGTATLEIDPADTLGITDGTSTGIYIGPCEIVLINGAQILTVDTGTMTIYSNVGTP